MSIIPYDFTQGKYRAFVRTTYKNGKMEIEHIDGNKFEFDSTKEPPVPKDTWVAKTWNGTAGFYGRDIWTDGTNIYCSQNSSYQRVLNGDTWEPKTWKWNGVFSTGIEGENIWTDGEHIYYSSNNVQYVLNGDTWSSKTWVGLTKFDGKSVWTNNGHIYTVSSYPYKSYELNKNTNEWEPKTWNGELSNADGRSIWKNNEHIYYSSGSRQCVLNGDTWEPKIWNITSFYGQTDIWTDGINIYMSYMNYRQYVLNGDTWEPKIWNGLTESDFSSFYGYHVWTDGENIYFSGGHSQYVLT